MYLLNDNARNATMCVSWKHHSLFLCEAYERVIWWFDGQISFGVSLALKSLGRAYILSNMEERLLDLVDQVGRTQEGMTAQFGFLES